MAYLDNGRLDELRYAKKRSKSRYLVLIVSFFCFANPTYIDTSNNRFDTSLLGLKREKEKGGKRDIFP